VVRATEASAVDCCKGPEPLRCSCRSPLRTAARSGFTRCSRVVPSPGCPLLFLPLVYPTGSGQSLARQTELIRWGANSAKLFSMENFKNRLAAILPPPSLARSTLGVWGVPDSCGGRGSRRRPCGAAWEGCIPCNNFAYPATRTLQRVPCNAYPATAIPQSTCPLW